MTMITLVEQGLSWYWCWRTIAIAISIKYIMVLLISLARHNLTLITKTTHRNSPETHSVDCYEFSLVAMKSYEPSHCPPNKLHAGISMYTLGALLYTNDVYSAFSDRHKKFLKYFWKSERKYTEKWQFWALYVEGLLRSISDFFLADQRVGVLLRKALSVLRFLGEGRVTPCNYTL